MARRAGGFCWAFYGFARASISGEWRSEGLGRMALGWISENNKRDQERNGERWTKIVVLCRDHDAGGGPKAGGDLKRGLGTLEEA